MNAKFQAESSAWHCLSTKDILAYKYSCTTFLDSSRVVHDQHSSGTDNLLYELDSLKLILRGSPERGLKEQDKRLEMKEKDGRLT
jgi:hypothetical protein